MLVFGGVVIQIQTSQRFLFDRRKRCTKLRGNFGCTASRVDPTLPPDFIAKTCHA